MVGTRRFKFICLILVGWQSRNRHGGTTITVGALAPSLGSNKIRQHSELSFKTKTSEECVEELDQVMTGISEIRDWNDFKDRIQTNVLPRIKQEWNEFYCQIQETDWEQVLSETISKSQIAFENACTCVRDTVRELAKLSLEDYKWRSALFKNNAADRMVKESMARMVGEDPSYVRPMDAGEERMGPLGRAEKWAVDLLSRVIEEEGKRAEQIANSKGPVVWVRPMDVSHGQEVGPLAFLEKQAVDFFEGIRQAEKERVETGTLRPKDLDYSRRGPLGDAEAKAVTALTDLRESEKLRMNQSRKRGGEVVRPLDVPGPLGEWELALLSIFDAERGRAKEARQDNEGRLVRPKDASIQGPLGTAEQNAVDNFKQLQVEEQERLRNIQRVMQENRPMDMDRLSPLGIAEALVVGILRAPRLVMSVSERVKELMSSEPLDEQDEEILKQETEQQEQPFQLRLPDEQDPFS